MLVNRGWQAIGTKTDEDKTTPTRNRSCDDPRLTSRSLEPYTIRNCKQHAILRSALPTRPNAWIRAEPRPKRCSEVCGSICWAILRTHGPRSRSRRECSRSCRRRRDVQLHQPIKSLCYGP